MDALLTPVSTTYRRTQKDSKFLLTEVKPSKPVETEVKPSHVSSAGDALKLLRSQPDYHSLISILRFLTCHGPDANDFRLHAPTPKSAAIIQSLVTEIAPNYWALLVEDSVQFHGKNQPNNKELFVKCLRSVTGINAIVSHIRALIQESAAGVKESARPDIVLHLDIFLDLIAAVLEGDESIRTIWATSILDLSTEALKKGQSQSLLSLLTSGRLVSVTAEASNILRREQDRSKTRWISDGLEVSKWVGRNTVSWTNLAPSQTELQFCCDLFQRTLSLGYSESLIKLVIDKLLLANGRNPTAFCNICLNQKSTAKKVVKTLLDYLSDRFLNRLGLDYIGPNATVSAVAGIINSVTQGNESIKAQLVSWCITSSGAGLGHGLSIRRAVLCVLAQDKETINTVLEKSLVQFGDELYIKHAAVLQQNVHAEVLLLSAGYVFRLSPMKLTMLLRSGTYLSAISNRIAATQVRARFLGLIVGECFSALVDTNDKKLDFHTEEMDTHDVERLKSLVKVSDQVGSVDCIMGVGTVAATTKSELTKKRPGKKQKPSPRPVSSTKKPKAIIKEVGASEDEEGDLAPYAKNTDPEDSDEDPELIQRSKLRPPVYIRDLIAFLRDSDTYHKQKLGLQTAPVLIRRKANYGTEVSSHADELAGLLVGVQDKFEIENFSELKLQGMVALIVAQPKTMAPWFARTFFEGDYSLSQRTAVLVSLGLSARELAGFSTSEYQIGSSFPSKQLPEKMEQLYIKSTSQSYRPPASRLKALPSTALDTITKSITSIFLAPIAAEAADNATGPGVLKLETFTARYKSRSTKKPHARAIPNTAASLLASSIFSPLTAHFQVAIRSSKPVILNPALLGLYLQTLGIILHAAGPSTLSISQLTSELWDLLLGVRQHVLGDLGASKGWLIAMASLMAVNEGDLRRLCEVQGREVVETRAWVSGVFERTRGEDGGEENEVKMLAAGVLIKIGEAIEKYQALLMGDMIGGP